MFKDIFNGIIKQKNLSLYKVAKDTKIPKTIVYDWAAGVREPVSEYIIILADYLGCSVDFLLGRENNTADENPTRILKAASSGIKPSLPLKKSLIEDMIYQKPLDINTHASTEDILLGNDDFWIVMQDNSMEGEHIFDGTEVLIRRDIKPQNGDIAALFVKGKGIILRRFYEDDGVVILEAANALVVPMELKHDEVTVIGRAAAIKSII